MKRCFIAILVFVAASMAAAQVEPVVPEPEVKAQALTPEQEKAAAEKIKHDHWMAWVKAGAPAGGVAAMFPTEEQRAAAWKKSVELAEEQNRQAEMIRAERNRQVEIIRAAQAMKDAAAAKCRKAVYRGASENRVYAVCGAPEHLYRDLDGAVLHYPDFDVVTLHGVVKNISISY
jgi:hypothetical protein